MSRPPLPPVSRVGRAVESMVPGSIRGEVASARPITGRSIENLAELEDVSDPDKGGSRNTKFYEDTFILTGSGQQDLTLTFKPILHSEHLYWLPGDGAGIYQREGKTWIRPDKSKRVITIYPNSETLPGDIIVVEYAYDEEQPAEPPPPPVVPGELVYIDSTIIDEAGCGSVAIPPSAQVGDMMVVGFAWFTYNGAAGPYHVTTFDPRLTVLQTYEVEGFIRAFAAVGTVTEDLSNLSFGGPIAGDMVVSVFRNVSYSGTFGAATDGTTPVIPAAYNAVAVTLGTGPFGSGNAEPPTGYDNEGGDSHSPGGQAEVCISHWESGGTPTSTPAGTYVTGGAPSACVVIEVH